LKGEDVLKVGHSMERETQESSLVEISHPNSEDIIAFLDTPGIDDDRPANEVLISVNAWLKRSAYFLITYIVTEKQEEITTTMFTLVDF
jgi:GTPase Era involved in 16S rRNA processing